MRSAHLFRSAARCGVVSWGWLDWLVYTADDRQTIRLEILNLETGESQALTNDEHIYVDPGKTAELYSPETIRLTLKKILTEF